MTLQKPGSSARRASRVSARLPSLKFERAAWKSGYQVVAGVDEVGRGAWAGPLIAAALILPEDRFVRARLTRTLNRHGLVPRDSKQLNHAYREQIVDVLEDAGIEFAIAELTPSEIDAVGIGVANRQVLCDAVGALADVDYALIDAFQVDDMQCDRRAVIGGDRVCFSIALASIVAKVHRDRFMIELDRAYPEYGFGTHKGYGTRAHADALVRAGVTEHHRKSFRPVAERLERG